MATAVGAGSSVTGSCDGTTDRAGHFIVTVDSGGKGTENIFFDGKNVTAFNTATSQYCTLPASTGMQGSVQPLIQTAMTVFTKDSKSFMLLPLSLILPQLYSQGHYLDNSANLTSKYGVLEGQAVINVSQINSMGQMKSNLTFSIDPTTNLLAGIGMEVDTAPGKVAIAWSEDFTSLRPIVNVAAVPSFVFVAPVGSTKVAAIQEPSAPPSKLLAVGKPAPNFSVMAADGSLVKLSKYAGKVVVLDFWATWCGPCQASLPHTDAIAKVYLRKGVVFLPICSWDDKSAFTTWRKAHSAMAMKFYYDPAGQNGTASVASKLYGVDGIPTQYVIGKHGKVAASFVGYDEQGDPNENSLKNALNAALAKP
jgi:thiol-disulfide isomerase/thioredoxin